MEGVYKTEHEERADLRIDGPRVGEKLYSRKTDYIENYIVCTNLNTGIYVYFDRSGFVNSK